MSRNILHVDLDQFLVAVELLRRPELRGRPVVVGGVGDPTRRGVVATASYEARRFGVHSGVPLRTAARRCPDAVFLPMDVPAYRDASDRVMAVLAEVPGTLEVAGWDEAFIEVESDDPIARARGVQAAVREATGLACSVGIGDNKLQAKVASGLAKPGGVRRLCSADWTAVMGARPTRALWGVGPKRQRRLAALGIATVTDLAGADPGALAREFGPRTGPHLQRLARGEDESPVVAARPAAKSHGRERTFERDLDDPVAIRRELRRLADELAELLELEGRDVVGVTAIVRLAPFETHTHRVPVPPGPPNADALATAGLIALEELRVDRPVRLLGLRADLAPPARGPEAPEAADRLAGPRRPTIEPCG